MKFKLSRSFLLGLGSGFILSASIAVVFIVLPDKQEPIENSTVNIQAPKEEDSVNQNSEVNTEQDHAEDPNTLFTISQGDNASDIANHLVKEQWIKSEEKTNFLNFIHENKLAKKFKVGNYKLVPGLTIEEIVNRLI